MRLVLDTNTVVSGLLWDRKPSLQIKAALQGHVEVFTSQTLLLELEDVLPRRKLARRVSASGLSVAQLTARFALLARIAVPAAISPISVDPDDDHVLACALAAQADLIISGDSDLLNLKFYRGIPILAAAEGLERIAIR